MKISKIDEAYGRGVTAGKLEALNYTESEREAYGKHVRTSEMFNELKESMNGGDTVVILHDSSVAATWPEGCMVLSVDLFDMDPETASAMASSGFVNGQPNWSTAQISCYHRPDWCDPAKNGSNWYINRKWAKLVF